MKRGRPTVRVVLQKNIIEVLSKFQTPINISTLTNEISRNLNKQISWNTVEKYTRELVETGKVEPIQLPHSKNANKNGLVLYALKK